MLLHCEVLYPTWLKNGSDSSGAWLHAIEPEESSTKLRFGFTSPLELLASGVGDRSMIAPWAANTAAHIASAITRFAEGVGKLWLFICLSLGTVYSRTKACT